MALPKEEPKEEPQSTDSEHDWGDMWPGWQADEKVGEPKDEEKGVWEGSGLTPAASLVKVKGDDDEQELDYRQDAGAVVPKSIWDSTVVNFSQINWSSRSSREFES